MINASETLYFVFFALCGILVILSIAVAPKPQLAKAGRLLTTVAAAVGVTGLVARTLVAGHLPIFGTFENAWTCAVALVLFSAVAPRFLGGARDMWRWMTPWSLIALIYGAQFRSDPVALTISEQSLWVDVHVLFAWLAFSALLCAASMSLIKVVGPNHPGTDIEESQRIHDRLLLGGYVAFTAMLVTGAFYLWVLFATLWRWEIVGVLSLLVWLLYGILIHGRLFYRWHGRGYHAGVLAILPVLLLAFWVWSLYPGTYHFFDIPLVRPY